MMKVNITKVSDYNFQESRTIEGLEDLRKIQEEFDNELIINFLNEREQEDQIEHFDIDIIIYDDYIE